MNDTKPWYVSTTVWASLVQILVGLAVSLGFVDQAAGTTIADQAPGLIIAIVTSLSGVLTLYGRVTATKQITATKQA